MLNNNEMRYMNTDAMAELRNLPLLKVAIIILLIITVISVIMRLIGIRSIFKDKGISAEIANITAIKKRDKFILRANAIIRKVTRLVNKTGFNVSTNRYEYMEYNLRRAGVKIPGGFRVLTPDEFNALMKIGSAITAIISLLVTMFINVIFGLVMLLGGTVLWSIVPMLVIRNIVAGKDEEIKKNFFNLYIMLHYTLVEGASTPIAQLMRSYGRQTNSKEMTNFIDTCTDIIDTYGEYNATRLIAKEYREIVEVGKLMRLIRQSQEGAEVKQELIGFKSQLMKERAYEIEAIKNKHVGRARASFKVLTIILVQAIISAAAIYFPDIANVTSFF